MMYLRWLCYLPLSLAMKILCLLFADIIALFADKSGWLPDWLSWFQTLDNSLDGDLNFKENAAPYTGSNVVQLSKYETWRNRSAWIRRNSAYGFKINVIGFHVDSAAIYKAHGNDLVSDRPLSTGYVLRTRTNPNGSKCFQFYAVYKWHPKFCLRIMAGWKIWGANNVNKNIQFAVNFNPFKSYGDVR